MWLLLSLVLTAAVEGHPAEDPAVTLGADPEVRAFFTDLFIRAGSGTLYTESAAFLVVDDSSEYGCKAWPYTGEHRRETFHGVRPPATIAIAHTHPNRLRRPSVADVQTARALNVPVFVLTAADIYVATPDGRTLAVVKNRFWPLAERRRCEQLPRQSAARSRTALATAPSAARSTGR